MFSFSFLKHDKTSIALEMEDDRRRGQRMVGKFGAWINKGLISAWLHTEYFSCTQEMTFHHGHFLKGQPAMKDQELTTQHLHISNREPSTTTDRHQSTGDVQIIIHFLAHYNTSLF